MNSHRTGVFNKERGLSPIAPGAPVYPPVPLGGIKFRLPQFPDSVVGFVVESGRITAMKLKDPSGELSFPKK